MQEKTEYYGTLRAGSNQMQVMDRKQKIYMEWPIAVVPWVMQCGQWHHCVITNHLVTKISHLVSTLTTTKDK